MARVCQADGGAIAARRILEEKHEIVVPRSRRDRTCFLSPFFVSVSRIFPGCPRIFPPPALPLAIKSDLTSIYLRIQSTRRHRRGGPSFSFFPFVRAESTLRMNFAYKLPITFFSSTVHRLIRRPVGVTDIARASAGNNIEDRIYIERLFLFLSLSLSDQPSVSRTDRWRTKRGYLGTFLSWRKSRIHLNYVAERDESDW